MDSIPDLLKIPKEDKYQRRILESAKTLFIEQGVENVNMHQIAKMAGVGQASLYRRYSEIGDICIEIVREECQPLFDEVQVYLDQASDTLPLERLYQVIVRLVSFIDAKNSWLNPVNRSTPGYRPLQSPLFKWMRNISRDLLYEAIRIEEIGEVDVLYTVEALLSVLQNIDILEQDQEFEIKRIIEGLQRIFIEGLKK